MLDNIKRSLKHSAIYSLGNIATKLIGVVLLPLYTKHISVAEYGVLGILEITIMILTQALILGQPQAFLRFYNVEEYKEKRKSTLFTMFIFLFAVGLLFNLLGQSLSTKISLWFFKPAEFAVYFKLCFYIIFLYIVNNLFLSVLRVKEKSAFYAIANIVKLAFILGFNIYFIAFAKIGIKGILYSYLIGDGILLLILFPNMVFEMTPKFDRRIFSSSLTFGLPLIFVSLSVMLLDMGDKYILKLLVGYTEVGIYNLGYKIAGVLNVFLIQSFSLALLPIAYEMYGKKGAKRYYSKMLTYFVFILCWAGLGLALFGKEIVRTLALNSDYWPAYSVIPIITLSYIFNGAKSIATLGLYLTGKTKYIAYNTVIALVINIGLNFLLIQKYGIMGAAVATLIAFIILYFLSYFVSNHFYKIPYENLKLLKLLILTVVLYFISTFFSDTNIFINIIVKIAVLTLFPFILYTVNFYEPIELLRLKQSWHKWKNPGKWKGNISKN